MIVDASAILAVLFDEPEGPAFKLRLVTEPGELVMSPVNYVEAAVRADSKPEKGRELHNLLRAFEIELAPITPEQARLAREAYRKFGKGNHPARLNLGDCFAYALAKARGEKLLFKGDDFPHTDIEAAV